MLSSPTRAYTATQAKNEFGRVLDAALQGATVVITKHRAPRAVLISIDEFTALQQASQLLPRACLKRLATFRTAEHWKTVDLDPAVGSKAVAI